MNILHFVYPYTNTFISNLLARIMQDFPCFVSSKPILDYTWEEVSIECRTEDYPAIEQRLASYLGKEKMKCFTIF